MAPPRTGATQTLVRILPGLMGDLDAWIEAQPGPRLGRPEAIRRLLTQRLEGDAELRRGLIALAGKIDGLVARARRVEAERDALATRVAMLEAVLGLEGEQFAARQLTREPADVERSP